MAEASGTTAQRAGRWRVATLGAALLVAGGCAVPLAKSCPSCPTLVIGERPAVPPGTHSLYLLLPGLLGYGWEWEGARAELSRKADGAVLVYDWMPWQSVAGAGTQLAAHLAYLERRLPPSVEELVIISHSAAGLVALEAAARLPSLGQSRPMKVRLLTVGAPFAGLGRNPWGGADHFHTPLPIALGSRFAHWPAPGPRVKLEVFVTGSDDPVMRPFADHNPGDPRVLPPQALVRRLPAGLDHNLALAWVCSHYVLAAQPELRPADAPSLPMTTMRPLPQLSGPHRR